MSQFLVARANATMLAVLTAILLLIGLLMWDGFLATRSARGWVEHTWQALATLKDLSIATRDAETGQRGFLLTGDAAYLAPYDAAVVQVISLQGELQRLTADSPAQQDRLRVLTPLLQFKLRELAQTVQLRRDAGLDAALQVVRTDAGRGYMTGIKGVLGAMTADEQALLVRRMADADSRGALVRWLAAAGTLLAVAALAWAARMLNSAWRRSNVAEAEQRTLALRLRTSLDSLSQGVAVFGADGRLAHWNECFQTLLHLPRAMVRAGTPYAVFAEHVNADGAVLESEDEVRQRQGAPELGTPELGTPEPVTCERTLPDGRHLELRRTPTLDAGFVLTVTDMTKRAQAEAVLRESQKMQAIGQLTGGIAHDFNNLLTVILGNLELMRTAPDETPRLLSRVDRATWAAQRGATLTSQLLSFARKQPLAPAAVDLAANMPVLVPLLQRTLGEHIDVRYVEPTGLWPAHADAAQLENAVLNLALNARDAMPDGGRLTIELGNMAIDADYADRHAEVSPGDYVALAVSDTGHGMTKEVAARVFEPFFTTKPEGKGTGLGLAMVFGFVKQSGGHVGLYSEPGHGTTVRMYLPRAAAAPAVEHPGLPADLPRGTATILLVEDEPAVREIAGEILRGLGYRVLDAADGEEALHVFGAHAAAVDLLLTDVVLPGALRGRDVAERISAVRPEVRVLFMSGYTENSIVHHGRLDAGVQLISKPFKRDQLARKVAQVLCVEEAESGEAVSNIVALKSRRID
jgi:signal transduction histidine kinase/CheY-like chemotaxis protein